MQRPRPDPEEEPDDDGEEEEEEPQGAAAALATGEGIQRSTFGEGGEKYDLKTTSIMSDTAFKSLPLSAQTLQASFVLPPVPPRVTSCTALLAQLMRLPFIMRHSKPQTSSLCPLARGLVATGD